MKRVVEALDSLPFWIAVFIVGVLFVFAYAYANARSAAAQNAEVIDQQQAQLAQLCETIAILDVLTVQQARVTTETLRLELPTWARSYLVKREALLNRTHAELAETTTCRQIE